MLANGFAFGPRSMLITCGNSKGNVSFNASSVSPFRHNRERFVSIITLVAETGIPIL